MQTLPDKLMSKLDTIKAYANEAENGLRKCIEDIDSIKAYIESLEEELLNPNKESENI